MAKQSVPVKSPARRRGRRSLDELVRVQRPLGFSEAELEALLLDDEPHRALAEPDIGVDSTAFYRWRRVRSEPPPPMGPSGSGLGRYKPRGSRS